MADQLLDALAGQLSSLELQPSSGGCFEVTVDGKLVFSKLQEGRFPTEEEVVGRISR